MLYIKEKDSDIWGPLQSRPRHNQSPVSIVRTKEDFVKTQESGKTNNPSELLQENLFNIQQNLFDKQQSLFDTQANAEERTEH